MAFSVTTNLGSLQAYNSLVRVNAETQKAQLRLATTKKINSVADDTSGFNVGKKLEAQTLKQKAQLNNVSSAKNYLATAETSLQQINDKLNQISAKYTDSKDPLKDKTSIASDIRTLAGEIDSILINTNINGHNLLAQSDGSALAASDTFDIGGTSFTTDFAANTYLNADAIKTILHGGATDPGVASYDGVYYNSDATDTSNIAINSTVEIKYADDTTESVTLNLPPAPGRTNWSAVNSLWNLFYSDTNIRVDIGYVAGVNSYFEGIHSANGKNIVSIQTTSGFDITTLGGITKTSSGGVAGDYLLSSDIDSVINSSSNISSIQNSVKSALGRIGNLGQTLESRSEFLTASIANNTNSISNIFDADMALEQLNATKGGIGVQITTAMLSQLNSAPQQMLTLFR